MTLYRSVHSYRTGKLNGSTKFLTIATGLSNVILKRVINSVTTENLNNRKLLYFTLKIANQDGQSKNFANGNCLILCHSLKCVLHSREGAH